MFKPATMDLGREGGREGRRGGGEGERGVGVYIEKEGRGKEGG
jgi:hypothetical protein